jgi:PIN domain nuclease of toxin-antitoxin system
VTAVLDASALIAFIEREPGWDKVAARLAGSFICAVNLSEVLAWVSRRGGDTAGMAAAFPELGIAVVVFDDALALSAANLFPATRPFGLSFGDRACLALAARLDLPALTADRAWEKVPAVGVELVR